MSDLLTLCREQVPELEWFAPTVRAGASEPHALTLGGWVYVTDWLDDMARWVGLNVGSGLKHAHVRDGDVREAIVRLTGLAADDNSTGLMGRMAGRRLLDLLDDTSCDQPGEVRILPTLGSLAGAHLKFSATTGCYCAEHWTLAGYGATDAT